MTYSATDGGPPAKKRGVTARTVDKWIAENDKVLSTATWLTYNKVGREYVATLECSVCINYVPRTSCVALETSIQPLSSAQRNSEPPLSRTVPPGICTNERWYFTGRASRATSLRMH